ncbi:hypothetical protein CFC21_033860 [Triticum aestivum]|uniref:F-box domain-containing protein n=2 Tax=Triticum aestivum TaxID=4565 RepID=A0A3B6EA91_WHEAT|nr:hypothetical protein CFC21_033860 [Triticum aestivum]
MQPSGERGPNTITLSAKAQWYYNHATGELTGYCYAYAHHSAPSAAAAQTEGSEDGDRHRHRRSPRLHSQTHASDEAVGVARCHPQLHASEEGARSQIHADGEGAGAIRRRGIFPAALASPIEDDDLLREILLRLPRQPSSLLRASAACKQWRCAATDPKFLHGFRLHHGKPPLLGLFHQRTYDDIVFTPILDHPDRMPPQRVDLKLGDSGSRTKLQVLLLDCRHGHGRVLLTNEPLGDHVIMCDPIIGEQRRVQVPPEFIVCSHDNWAVLCAASDHDHVHGSCHSSPFKLVLISPLGPENRLAACVYSSETGIWSTIIVSAIPYEIFYVGIFGLLVGNALYWLLDPISDGILEFDLDEQSLAVIKGPLVTNDFSHDSPWIIHAEDGARAFAYCLTITCNCGRGISIVMVLPHGCYGTPLTCVPFLGSLPRLKEGRKVYWDALRMLMKYFYGWAMVSIWFNLSQCSLGNFVKSVILPTVILSRVSILQVIVHQLNLVVFCTWMFVYLHCYS